MVRSEQGGVFMAKVPDITLNDGSSMPQLGFGLWQVSDEQAEAAALEATRVGYRSIDSAKIYENETGLGRAVKKCELRRNELFLTTKLWNSDQGYEPALKACRESLQRLGLTYLDLYLIHWPSPHRDLYVDSWRALIQLRKEGLVRSIGVSNFTIEQLRRLLKETGELPAVNQIELHPRFQQRELRAFHKEQGIATESWSPLGQGQLLEDPMLVAIAAKHGKSVAQVIIRWNLEEGLVVIPKSVTPSRIRENFEVLNFRLDADDRSAIARLDSSTGRIGPDPLTANF